MKLKSLRLNEMSNKVVNIDGVDYKISKDRKGKFWVEDEDGYMSKETFSTFHKLVDAIKRDNITWGLPDSPMDEAINESEKTKKFFRDILKYQRMGKEVVVFSKHNGFAGNTVLDFDDWFDGSTDVIETSNEDGDEEYVTTNDVQWFEVNGKRYKL